MHLQVAQHNTPDDCWVSIHGTVYDLTRLIKVRMNQRPRRSAAWAQEADARGMLCAGVKWLCRLLVCRRTILAQSQSRSLRQLGKTSRTGECSRQPQMAGLTALAMRARLAGLWP